MTVMAHARRRTGIITSRSADGATGRAAVYPLEQAEGDCFECLDRWTEAGDRHPSARDAVVASRAVGCHR